MPFLHTSPYEGQVMLAVISKEEVLGEGHHVVLDAELVDSPREAREWFIRKINDHPWGGSNDGEDSSLHIRDSG